MFRFQSIFQLAVKDVLGLLNIDFVVIAKNFVFESIFTFDYSLNLRYPWRLRKTRKLKKAVISNFVSLIFYLILPVALICGMRYGYYTGTICRPLDDN